MGYSEGKCKLQRNIAGEAAGVLRCVKGVEREGFRSVDLGSKTSLNVAGNMPGNRLLRPINDTRLRSAAVRRCFVIAVDPVQRVDLLRDNGRSSGSVPEDRIGTQCASSSSKSFRYNTRNFASHSLSLDFYLFFFASLPVRPRCLWRNMTATATTTLTQQRLTRFPRT